MTLREEILQQLDDYGLTLTKEEPKYLEFTDVVSNCILSYSPDNGMSFKGIQLSLDPIVFTLLKQIDNSYVKDNLVVINGVIKLSNQLTFKSGSILNKYYVSYGKGSINVLEWGNKNILSKDTRIAVIGYLQENTYTDKQGEFKTLGNEVIAYQIATDNAFEVSLPDVIKRPV